MNPALAGSLAVLAAAYFALPWLPVRWAAASLLCFLGLGALWSAILRRGLAGGGTAPLLRTFSGRRLEVGSRLENRTPLPAGRLFWADSAGGLESWGETRRWVTAPPFTRQHLEFAVRGRERGERHLGPLTVSGTDPTGLFPFRLEGPARTLIVYPRLRPVQGSPRGGLPGGPRRWDAAPLDDPSRFRSFRPFEPGDSLARISAAAWARTGFPQVRLFDRTAARPTVVAVDLRASGYPLKLRWALVEAAVETAAALLWELVGRGETVWLTVADAPAPERPRTLGPCVGYAAARPLLERLALAVPDRTEATADPGGLPGRPVRVLWIGPALAAAPVLPGREVVRVPIGEEASVGVVTAP